MSRGRSRILASGVHPDQSGWAPLRIIVAVRDRNYRVVRNPNTRRRMADSEDREWVMFFNIQKRGETMKKTLVVLCIVFTIVEVKSQIVVSGKVDEVSGKLLRGADVRLSPINGYFKSAKKCSRVDKNGFFKITIAKSGLYKVWFSAANRPLLSFPLILTAIDKNLGVRVVSPSRVKSDFVSIEFDKAHIYLTDIAKLDVEFQRYFEALKKEHERENGKESELKIAPPDFSNYDSKLLQTMRDTSLPEMVRQYTAMQILYIRHGDNPQYKERAFCDEVLKLLPTNSSMWAIDPRLISMLASSRTNNIVRIYTPFYKPQPNEIVTHSDSEYRDAVSRIWEPMYQMLREFANKNPERSVRAEAIRLLTSNAMLHNEPNAYALYEELKAYRDIEDVKGAIKRFDPNRRIQTGKPLPEFSAALLGSQQTVTNQTYKGKYLLLDFWAVWCGPCVGSLPRLHQVYERFKGENFKILSISFDNSPSDIEKFRSKSWKMPWQHVFAKGGFNSELGRKFEVTSIPRAILVGPDGIILNVDNQGENFETTLTNHLRLTSN